MSLIQTKRTSVEWLSLFSLALPFFILVIAAYYAMTGRSVSPLQKAQMNWVSKVVFLNATHVMMTYVHLLFLPEFREVQAHAGLSWKKIFFLLALAMAFSFPILTLNRVFFLGHFLVYATIPIILLSLIHNWRQSMGLSFLYNRESSADPESDRKSRQAEKLATWFGLVGATLLTGYHARTDLRFPILLIVGTGLSACSVLFYVRTFFLLRSHPLFWQKLFFNARVVVRFLAPFSSICFYGSLAIHGVEYFCVDEQVRSRSKASGNIKILLPYLILFLLIVKSQLDFPLKLMPGFGFFVPLDLNLSAVLIAFGFSLTLVHYYLDAFLYRVRDPVVRREIGPLIGLYGK